MSDSHQEQVEKRSANLQKTRKAKAGLVIVLFVSLSGVVRAQEKLSAGDQGILQFDHIENGRMCVVPRADVYFSIKSDSHLAPLNHGDFLLCRVHDLKDQAGITHVSFKCGADEYIIQTIAIKPAKKEETKPTPTRTKTRETVTQ